jgi:HAT1-interacting factor 1
MAELPAGTLSKDTFRNEEHDRLKNLTAEATLKYSIHDYDAAAELYSQATELQAKLNGEMSSLNADLLYQYGKCLYHVAVRKSDVLGSRAAGEKSEEGTLESSSTQPLTKRKSTETTGDGPRVAREVISSSIEGRDVSEKRKEQSGNKNKPFFQFTGDENFESYDDEDDMGDGADDEEEAEDEEDDLVTAYEVLDLARVLFLRRLEEAPERDGDPQDLKYLKERLADTYDLQAEISLEGERFPLAVEDLKAALELKMALFPPQSSLIAEAHYKLSLALEFSSVTEQKGLREEDEGGAQAKFDQVMREAAAKEMEAAIGSCKLRMKEEEAKLEAASSSYDDSVKSGAIKRNIEDVKEIVNDMEQRVNLTHFASAMKPKG